MGAVRSVSLRESYSQIFFVNMDKMKDNYTNLNTMDWNLIKTFLAVAETGTLLAAAEALRLSQPTVGRHIDELEAATGLTLFIRGRRGMALTEAGLSLLDDARSMAKEADHFLLRASGRASEASGPVRITASDIVANYLLPPILVALKDAEPGIDIELAPSNAVANLLARDADIAIRMTRPIQNDLIAVKLNDLPWAPMRMSAISPKPVCRKRSRIWRATVSSVTTAIC